MKEWLIDFGNSSTGPIGGVARVAAPSAEEALIAFKTAVGECMEQPASNPFSYFHIYINADAITLNDVVEADL